jgi:hypothetical protein
LREQVLLIADALDTEVTRAALALTTFPAVPGAPMDDGLEQAWSAWKRDAPWPQIVSGVLFLESRDGGWRTRSWGDPGSFDVRSVPPTKIRVEPRAPSSGGGGTVHAQVRGLALYVDGEPCLLRPIPTLPMPPGPLQMSWVLIRFDLSSLTSSVFPRLLERHSISEDRSEYLFRIERKDSAGAEVVTVEDVFRFRPDCLLASNPGEPELTVSRVEGHAGRPSLNYGGLSSPIGGRRQRRRSLPRRGI